MADQQEQSKEYEQCNLFKNVCGSLALCMTSQPIILDDCNEMSEWNEWIVEKTYNWARCWWQPAIGSRPTNTWGLVWILILIQRVENYHGP